MKYYWWKMEPYRDNPIAFVREMIGAEPTDQQIEALTNLANGTHVSIKSGHGTGKTTFLAWAILWWNYTRPNARIPCTAPTEAQLKNVLWAELSIWHNEMDEFFKGMFIITSDKMYHVDYDKTWFAVARTARSEKPEALQGFHGENLLFIIDEASGVAEEVFTVVRGALTEEDNRCVMTSNPTRTSGFFYNSHSLWEGDPWSCLTFNGEESPRVSERFVSEMATEYGEDSDMYRIRVLGQFPIESDFTLIPKDWVMEAFDREVSPAKRLTGKSFDAAGVDVARYGENKTVFVLVKGVTVIGIKQYQKQSTMKTAAQVVALCKTIEPENIKIDEVGVGAGVVDRVLEQGYNVTGVEVGRAAIEKDKFANLRAEYYWQLRKRFEEGSISLYPMKKTLSKPDKIKFIEQICSIRYEHNPSGKIAIWSKEKMRRDGLKSPDLADALMLAFADYYPELWKPPKRSALQKWSDKLEGPATSYEDPYEQFAQGFHQGDGYKTESQENEDREDGMVWN
jgi:phage terminase large subunit